jgi:putative ABC transport system substrate-binding protein
MRRRDFIQGIVASTAWPLAARAQQTAMPVIGLLHIGSPAAYPQLEFLRQGLRENGFVEGQNVAIDYRWADGQSNRLPELAADLVRGRASVIAAVSGTNAALAAKTATSTIPIVFLTGGDPVKLGLVSSLSRPEANVTGVSFIVEDLGAKEVGLLHELVPGAKNVSLLVNPDNPNAPQQIENLQEAARVLGLGFETLKARNANGLEAAFNSLAGRPMGAMLVAADPQFGTNVNPIVAFIARHKIPTVYYRREFVDAGGLMSYGTSASDAWHQVGIYVARILKGAKPADLPVMRSTKFELVINLKTAKTLGLEIPAQLLARADDAIE